MNRHWTTKDVESQTESGVRRFLGLGSHESPKFSLKYPTSDSLEKSHFYAKNLRKCDISEKTSSENFFFTKFFWLINCS